MFLFLNFAEVRAIIIIFVFLLSSCVTQKRCLHKFPPKHDTTIVYKDTVITKYIPEVDTVYKYGTIRDTVYASAGTAHSISYVTHDTLKLFVWQSDTTLQIKLDSAIQQIQIKDTEIITIKEKAKFWDRIEAVGWIILAIVLLVIIGKVINLIK